MIVESEITPIALAGEYTNQKIIDSIFQKIIKKNISECSILDLGTGNGYNVWLIREYLKREIFKNIKINISCSDIDLLQFKLSKEGISFYTVDFDKTFDFGKFDFVIATEIIEHLENPYFFLRNCFSMLNKKGTLFLSTPNVINIFSCFKIFLISRPYLFSDLDKYGHKMPFFPFMLDHVIKFEEVERGYKFSVKKYFNKNILKLPFRKTIKIFGNNRWFGDSAIFEIEDISSQL